MDKVTRQCPQTATFLKRRETLIVRDKVTVSINDNFFEEKGEPKRNRAEALLLTSQNNLALGQTGSLALLPYTTFEEKGQPKRNRVEVLLHTKPNALPLGHPGSRMVPARLECAYN